MEAAARDLEQSCHGRQGPSSLIRLHELAVGYRSGLPGEPQAAAFGKMSRSSLVRMDSGIAQGSRWGFRGVEDLGSGRSAYFTLESGFSSDDGALGQGGAIFGRQAYVGMKDGNLGSLAFGRQYDFMSYLGAFYAMVSQSAAGLFAWGLHADAANNLALNDHTYAGDRTNNSVKYESPQFGPLSFGAMYGFGEVPGNPASGRTVSARISADFAKFSTSAAYTDVRNAAGDASVRIYGLGASYQEGDWRPFGMIPQARNRATNARATTYELGVTYALTRALDFSAAYQYQQRNHDIGDAQAAIATFDYKFSNGPMCTSPVFMTGTRDSAHSRSSVAASSPPTEYRVQCAWASASNSRQRRTRPFVTL